MKIWEIIYRMRVFLSHILVMRNESFPIEYPNDSCVKIYQVNYLMGCLWTAFRIFCYGRWSWNKIFSQTGAGFFNFLAFLDLVASCFALFGGRWYQIGSSKSAKLAPDVTMRVVFKAEKLVTILNMHLRWITSWITTVYDYLWYAIT